MNVRKLGCLFIKQIFEPFFAENYFSRLTSLTHGDNGIGKILKLFSNVQWICMGNIEPNNYVDLACLIAFVIERKIANENIRN